jgi:hypothetical protein
MSESGISSKLKKRSVPALKQVQLKLVHIEVWSAVKAGFLVTLATAVATVAAFFGLWLVVGQLGLFASLNSLLAGVFGEGGVNVEETLSLPRVMSFATTLGFVNIVLGTLLTALVAMIFNVIGKITGGIAISFTNN